jgi:RNA polymerase sigma-70 factor (ECF subfamily)
MDDLLKKLMQGDSQAWQNLYTDIGPGLYRFLLSRVHDEQVTQDLLQEGFYLLAKNLATIKDGHSIKSWLYSTCYRLTVDWHRQNRAFCPEEWAALAEGEGADPLGALIRREEKDAVLEALMSLSDPQRTVILLRIWGGLSYSEIAAMTGLSQGTLRSQYYWAMRRLRQILRNEPADWSKDVTANE